MFLQKNIVDIAYKLDMVSKIILFKLITDNGHAFMLHYTIGTKVGYIKNV